MGDVMNFPATFEEFAKTYKIVDSEQIYTNGTELLPIFRVNQWLEHKSTLNQAEIRVVMNYCQNQIESAKTKAIKEFAERLKGKKRLVKANLNDIGECLLFGVLCGDIDNLVKEMAGEE